MFYATIRDEENSFTLEKKSIFVFERIVMNIGGQKYKKQKQKQNTKIGENYTEATGSLQ